MPRSDDPIYVRRPVSNRDGFAALDRSLEKIETKARLSEKLCDVCGRRCRAWRIVPASAGKRLGPTRANLGSGGLTGKFLVCCDAGPDGCASMLERSGVPKDAIEEEELMSRLGLVKP